jgi:hypothetical protein
LKKSTPTRKLAVVAICATLVISAQAESPVAKKKAKPPAKPAPKMLHLDQAYFAGRLVKFQSAPPTKHGHALVVGPWDLGEKVSPGRNDFRPNLYFVSPGTQHHVDGHGEFDHNDVLSAVPDDVSNFDVYWVVVLDPALDENFTSEQQIIMATQKTFTPPADFTFDQVPSAGFLKAFLKVKDVAQLEKFKRPDGELPRVAIVPAGFTVKATAEEFPDEDQTAQQSADSSN